MSSWLEQLRPGDNVIVAFEHGREVNQVSRLTKHGIVVGSSRYRKQDGKLCGASVWEHRCLQEATSDRVATVRRANHHKRLSGALSRVNWQDVSFSLLQQITQLISDDRNE